MNDQIKRLIELTRFRGSALDPDISAEQIKWYNDMADWIEAEGFETVEEVTEATKGSRFYLGGGEAKMLDDINMRIRAMEEIGYDDVANLHKERLDKFLARGYRDYCFSQDWIDDFNAVQEEMIKYLRRKEVFGRIFSGYFQIKGNPQQDHRASAVKGISKALDDLVELGVTFDELASQKAYRKLTMTTEKGMENFIAFIHSLMASGEAPAQVEMKDLAAERKRVSSWAASHTKELVEVGSQEQWHRANCIAVPSDDPLGYDYIAMKEVSE